MAISVLQSITDWYDASAIKDSIPGGMWTGLAPEGTALPYATLNLISSIPVWNMSLDYWEASRIRVSIFAIGAETARLIGADFHAEFRTASLVMTNQSVITKYLESKYLVADTVSWKKIGDVWQQALDFYVYTNRVES